MHNIYVIKNLTLIPFEEKISNSKAYIFKTFSGRLHIQYFNLLVCPRSDLENTKQGSYDMNKCNI